MGNHTVMGICGTSEKTLNVVAVGVDSVSAASNAVAVGESVTVVALPDPGGQSFPSGYPTWSPSGSVGATSSVTISAIGTNTVSATCGTSSQSKDVIGVGLTNLSGATNVLCGMTNTYTVQAAPSGQSFPGNWPHWSLTGTGASFIGASQGVSSVQIAFSTNAASNIIVSASCGTSSTNLDIVVLDLKLAVDNNRDGAITFDEDDKPTEEKPFRFWINDDQDVSPQLSSPTANMVWDDNDPETIPVDTPDYSDMRIKSRRDLEDFARLKVKIEGVAPEILSGQVKVSMYFTNVTSGTPEIKIWRNLSPEGGDEYLKDDAVAAQHLQLSSPGHIKGTSVYEVPQSYWEAIEFSATQPFMHLLFEGVSEGKGNLVVALKRNDEVIGSYSIPMELLNIEKMYMRAHATPKRQNFPLPYEVDQDNPAAPYVKTLTDGLIIPSTQLSYGQGFDEMESNLTFEPPRDEEDKCIVFVHGISMDIPSLKSYTASFYKRLWWEGYKGRLVAFRWSTPLDVIWNDGPDIFNDGEYRAWSGGTSLKKYVEDLRQQMGGNTRISIVGHSLGNACVGSALKKGLTVDSYVMMEAAVSMSCYHAPADPDQTDPLEDYFLKRLTDKELTTPTPHEYSQMGYRGFLKDIKDRLPGKLVSYHNEDDFWLATGFARPLNTTFTIAVDWVSNQEAFKPNDIFGPILQPATYAYRPENPPGRTVMYEITGYSNDRPVEDIHESLSYVSRSRTRAVGAEPGTGMPSPPGGSSLDLKEVYGFRRERPDHSGQFQRDIQRMYSRTDGTLYQIPFYKQLMEDLRVQPDVP